jgi:hypothetical protein
MLRSTSPGYMHIKVGVALSTRILKSQRGAVVGFIVSTLSWAELIPRLTWLGLSPNDETQSQISSKGRICPRNLESRQLQKTNPLLPRGLYLGPPTSVVN